MPLISCPNCKAALKVPDGASGNVKCPRCTTIFEVLPPAAPAFEVIEDEPVSPPPRAASRAARAETPFNFGNSSGSKSGESKRATPIEDDDEEDDRPRRKRRRRDDDEDDDDYDDRSRRKRRRRRDDDDDYDNRSRSVSRSAAGAAKVGMLLIVISLFLYFGTFALQALMLLIAFLGASIPNGLLIVPGLLGIVNWILALIGLGFCIAGPARARGLAIAATSVAAIHLIMGFVVANDAKSAFFGSGSIQFASEYSRMDRLERLSKAAQKDPNGSAAKELREEMSKPRDSDDTALGLGMALQVLGSQTTDKDRADLDRLVADRRITSKMRWLDMASQFPFFDRIISVLAYNSEFFTDYLLSFLSGALEVARLILLILTIGAVARAVKAYDAADKAQTGLIAAAICMGVALLLSLLVAVMLDSNASSLKKAIEKPPATAPGGDAENPFKSFMRTLKNYTCIGDLLILSLHAGALVFPLLAAHGAYTAAARKAR